MEENMQFIALIYDNEANGPDFGTPEFGDMMAGYKAASETYQKDGVMVSGEPLESVNTATTVRVRGGKVETMDGPFAETKEQLGGFYIFECEDIDAAIKYAALIPSAKSGCVEVRPIMKLPSS